jgi:hypothetical protein
MLWMAAAVAPDVVRDGKSEASAAALLLAPALLAAYIARPGEHAITTKMLRWARFVLVADGILPALAVYFLIRTREESNPATVFKFGPFSVTHGAATHGAAHALETHWFILAAISVLPVIAFIASNFTPVPHGGSVYRTPRDKCRATAFVALFARRFSRLRLRRR